MEKNASLYIYIVIKIWLRHYQGVCVEKALYSFLIGHQLVKCLLDFPPFVTSYIEVDVVVALDPRFQYRTHQSPCSDCTYKAGILRSN